MDCPRLRQRLTLELLSGSSDDLGVPVTRSARLSLEEGPVRI
jgi:hypothetical protein